MFHTFLPKDQMATTSPIMPKLVKVLCNSTDFQVHNQVTPPFSHNPMPLSSSFSPYCPASRGPSNLARAACTAPPLP